MQQRNIRVAVRLKPLSCEERLKGLDMCGNRELRGMGLLSLQMFSPYKVCNARKYQGAQFLVLMEISAKTRQRKKYPSTQSGNDEVCKQESMGQPFHRGHADHLPGAKAEFNIVFNWPIKLPAISVTMLEKLILCSLRIPQVFHG